LHNFRLDSFQQRAEESSFLNTTLHGADPYTAVTREVCTQAGVLGEDGCQTVNIATCQWCYGIICIHRGRYALHIFLFTAGVCVPCVDNWLLARYCLVQHFWRRL